MQHRRTGAKTSAVTLLSFGLAFIHLFPARKHLGLFFESPSFGEAWKGLGAVVAIVFVALPRATQVAMLWFLAPLGVQTRAMAAIARPRRVLRLATAPAMLAIAAAALWVGCGGTNAATPSDAGTADAAASAACPPCVTDQDCNGGVCAQLGSDSYCAPTCPTGNECAADRACSPVSTITGDQVNACVSQSGDCAAAVMPDGGPAPSTCPGLASPTMTAPCASCKGKPNCQTNGCYGGWWCNVGTSRCQSPPSSCGGGGGAGGPFDGGAPVTATIGAGGGTSSRLYFGVVGDTRPAGIDDTAGYPTAIIDKIYTDMEGLSPRPAFVVSTGDYMFASTSRAESSPQLDLYLGARAKYSGTTFAAMGNHECTGATASNCGAGSTDGVTANYTAFLQKMLGPIGKTDPYYSIRVDAPDATWTAKLVFVAANAWSDAQATWLDAELAKPTTYTFLVRHESRSVTQAPGVAPAEAIMAKYPYTLSFVGHTHTYEHFSTSREVVIGNGGAPATGSKNYGFAVAQQRPDGAIQVDVLDYATLSADTSFRFAVKADGTHAP